MDIFKLLLLAVSEEIILQYISLLAWDILKSPAKTSTDKKDNHELTVARNINFMFLF